MTEPTLTRDIGLDLAAQNVRYAEVTLTPYSSVVRGIAAEAFCEAVEDARRSVEAECDITLRWCFDIPGESGLPAADLTLDIALGHRTRVSRPGPRRCGTRSGCWTRSESATVSTQFTTRLSSSIWRCTRSR